MQEAPAQLAHVESLLAKGAVREALDVLAPLAAAHPASWAAQAALARARLAAGESREAARALRAALALDPDWAAGWRLLADIALFAGEAEQAQAAEDQHLRATTRSPELRAALALLADGRLAEAEAALLARLRADPHSTDTAHLLAVAMARADRPAEAARLLEACVRNAPDHAAARLDYALALNGAGRPAEALAQIGVLLARDPGDIRYRTVKSSILAGTGDYRAAAEVVRALLAEIPDQPRAWLIHGHSLRTIGEAEQSVAAFRRCLELDPDFAEAWWALANLKAYRFSPDEVAAMTCALEAAEPDGRAASFLHFALGVAEEQAGRPAEAFAHFAGGNRIEHARVGYEAERLSAMVTRAQALFTPAFFARRAGWGCPAPDPIFIVGLPRSGSTLVAQILASHPAVEATRELDDIQVIADLASGLDPQAYPQALEAIPRELAARLGADYVRAVQPLRKLGRPMFIDKAPWNFAHLGLIRMILPNARIIDVRRHPLSCCLSAYKQRFDAGWAFSYDLEDLGRYYVDYVRLMAHFDAVLPGRVLRVVYEELVGDTEGEVRRLLQGLGLPFDAACLRFFENTAPVATPSSEQVRRPIFTEGLEPWRPYEPWLGPLKAALGPVLDAYPAPPS